jgi:hypothetical protein
MNSATHLQTILVEKPSRTLRFVEFVNEEPPFFFSEGMGSLVYASRCKQRSEKVVAMLSLETIGYYSDKIGSQRYPLPQLSSIYPLQGIFHQLRWQRRFWDTGKGCDR